MKIAFLSERGGSVSLKSALDKTVICEFKEHTDFEEVKCKFDVAQKTPAYLEFVSEGGDYIMVDYIYVSDVLQRLVTLETNSNCMQFYRF